MSMRRRAVLVAGLVAATSGCTRRPATNGNSFAIRGARVFTGDRLSTDDTVLVEQGRIAALGKGLSIPRGVPVTEASGVLLPGLIDSHVHVAGINGSELDAPRFGVTTVIDMLGDHLRLQHFRAQRAALDPVTGADVWGAGSPATVPGGHGTQYHLPLPTITADTDLDRFVADRVAEGSDFLKVIIENGALFGVTLPTLDAAQVRHLVEAAHAGKVRVAVHVSTVAAARTAVDAGADLLAHVPTDVPIDPALLAGIKARTSGVIATLSVSASGGCTVDAAGLRGDPRITRYLSPAQRQSLGAAWPRCHGGLLDVGVANVAALRRANVPILAGTDVGNVGLVPGASLLGELTLLVRAGLTPVEALRAATATPARVFGLTDRGRIAPGLRADLVLVHGDPTTAIDDVRDIAAIWKNGYPVVRTEFS